MFVFRILITLFCVYSLLIYFEINNSMRFTSPDVYNKQYSEILEEEEEGGGKEGRARGGREEEKKGQREKKPINICITTLTF